MILRAFSALLIGAVFGLGLCVSMMANPEKVLAFLNVAGDWDPSLALVMVAALTVSTLGYWLLRGRKPLLAEQQRLPGRTDLDRPLLIGSLLFGLGWGLAGYCPGPGITALASGSSDTFYFLLSMLLGGQLAGFLRKGD